MAFQDAKAEQRAVTLKGLRLEAPWEALLLPVSGFPVPADERSTLQSFVGLFSQAITPATGFSAEVFIQFNQLHVEDGGSCLSAHGQDWMPQLGLGVWPEREPPTLWGKEDFEILPVGARPRPLSYQLFRITAPQPARLEARGVMLGRGTIIQVIIEDPAEMFFEKTKAFLLPLLKERAFRSLPFYLPLVEGKSAASAACEQLDTWLSGASAYIRESVEDGGLLIVCRQRLAPVLEKLGGRFDPGPEPMWQVPC